MNPNNAIREVRVHMECRLHPGISYDIIVPLLYGKSWSINRCENAAGSNPVCARCAKEVGSIAERLYQDLPDHAK